MSLLARKAGSLHTITPNTTVSPAHRAAFVVLDDVGAEGAIAGQLGDTAIKTTPHSYSGSAPAGWAVVYVEDDNTVTAMEEDNPNYRVTVPPSMPDNEPLPPQKVIKRWNTVEEAIAAYDALT